MRILFSLHCAPAASWTLASSHLFARDTTDIARSHLAPATDLPAPDPIPAAPIDDQHTENQIEQLEKAGCRAPSGRIYTKTASGGKLHRPELDACLNHLRKGDVLVVWKLDRLSRSLRDLLWILDRVDKVGAGFRSLTEHNDTTTPAGELMMNMLGSFAHDAERAIMQSHTAAVAV